MILRQRESRLLPALKRTPVLAKGSGFFLCVTHVECLGGESPLRAVMSGTVRLSKGVGREAESEGSEG